MAELSLGALVKRLLNSEGRDTRQMLEGPDGPRLLDPAVERALFRRAISATDPFERKALQNCAHSLAYCRQNGVAAYFAGPSLPVDIHQYGDYDLGTLVATFMTADSAEARQILEGRHGPRLLDPDVEQRLLEYAELEGDQDQQRAIRSRARLLARCREDGIASALKGSNSSVRDANSGPDPDLIRLMATFLEADFAERRKMLEGKQGQRLLNPVVEEIMLGNKTWRSDPYAEETVLTCARLLADCRRFGVSRCFDLWQSPTATVVDGGSLADDLHTLVTTFTRANLSQQREMLEGPNGDRLLDPYVEQLLMDQAQTSNSGAIDASTGVAGLLAFCRQFGVATYFDIMSQVQTGDGKTVNAEPLINRFINADPPEQLLMLNRNTGQMLLHPYVETAIRNAIGQHEEPLATKLREIADLLADCRRMGVAAASAAWGLNAQSAKGVRTDIEALINRFVRATAPQKRKLLEGKNGARLLLPIIEKEIRDFAMGQMADDPEYAKGLVKVADLLAECRLYGVAHVFDLAPIVNRFLTSQPKQMQKILESADGRTLLVGAEELFRRRARLSDDHNESLTYKAHADLLAACRRDGIPAAFAAWQVHKTQRESGDDNEQPLVDSTRLLNDFLRAEWCHLPEMLEGPNAGHLLDIQFEKTLRTFAEHLGGRAAIAFLHRADLLADCRRRGVQEAFSAVPASATASDIPFVALVRQFLNETLSTDPTRLEMHIDIGEQMLLLFESKPKLWGILQAKLGEVFLQKGQLAGDLQCFARAVTAFERAVETMGAKNRDEAIRRALVQRNLGLALLFQGTHMGKTESVSKAVAAFEHSLEVCTRATVPEHWATLQTDLGEAFDELSRLTGERDLAEASINAFNNALQVLDKEKAPLAWAKVQSSLGTVMYRQGTMNDDVRAFAVAESAFRGALAVYARDGSPIKSFPALTGLGRILADRQELDAAAKLYQQFLTLISSLEEPHIWAAANSQLGDVLTKLGKLSDAAAAYERALEIWNPDTSLEFYASTVLDLGRVLIDLADWARAVARLTPMMSLFVMEALAEADDERRTSLIARLSAIADDLAFSRLQLPNPDLADVLLTVGRSRALILNRTLVVAATRSPALREARAQWREAQSNLRRIERARYEEPKADLTLIEPESVAQSRATAEQAFRRFEAQMTGTELGQMQQLTVSAVAAAVPAGGALVVPLIPSTGEGFLLFLRRGDIVPEVLKLPGFNLKRLNDCRESWFTGYSRFKDSVGRDGKPAVARWNGVIGDVLRQMGELLMLPLHRRLQGALVHGAEVVFMPSGFLSFLPLHASPIDEEHLFLDFWAVRSVANLQMLLTSSSLALQRSRIQARLLAVTNPTEDPALENDSGHSSSLITIAPNPACAAFSPERRIDLCGRRGGVAAINDSAKGSTHLSFYCHGAWNPEHPDESGLYLADEERLTVDRLRSMDLNSSRFAMLAACETGLPDLADEGIGLPFALVEAGIPGVAASLWPVPAQSTRELVRRMFRQLIQQGRKPVHALRTVQRQLRNEAQNSPPPPVVGMPEHATIAPEAPVLGVRGTTDFVSWAGFACYGE